MSDIRSFFGSKSHSKKQVKNKSESSSKNANSKNEIAQTQKRKKKRQIILDSDSDEDPIPSKYRKSNNAGGTIKTSNESKERKNSKDDDNDDVSIISVTPAREKKKSKLGLSKPKENALKPTTANDFFADDIKPQKDTKKLDRQLESHLEKQLKPDTQKKSALQKKTKAEFDFDNDDFDVSAIDETFEEITPKKKEKKSSTVNEDKTPSHKGDKLSEGKLKDNLQKYLDKAEDTSKAKSPKGSTKTKSPQIKATVETPKNKSDKTKQISTEDSGSTPAEKKKSNYWAYRQREGPTNIGSKDIPEGAENCLEGLTFVITGVLESFEREQFVDCIQRYGGKVTGSVSGKTSYLIVGRDPGQSKIDKASKHKTKQINEDDFLELVKSRPAKHGPETPKPSKLKNKTPVIKPENNSSDKSFRKSKSPIKSETVDSQENTQSSTFSRFSANFSPNSTQSPSSQKTLSPQPKMKQKEARTLLWVDKYKPATLRNVVGQQGDKSNMNKLKKWLSRWRNVNQTGAPKPNFYSGKEDGSIFKAALLSGPPGIGKTTTATLVCQDVGFSYIEMNASDTRGKKSLETVIKESLSNTTITGMMQGTREDACRHVLIMDEVDGMAGNEDRGGMQELIQLIKKTRIPIICMCNDRNHPKVRSLANHCFDLRFYKPRVEQVKGFALSVAAKEGLKVPPQAMEQIVVGANQDIRQVLHNLQMWTATTTSISYDAAKENASKANKNIKLGPFDIVKQLYTHSEASKMSINEKSDLFFMDYSFIPLFMQENYLMVNPAKGRGDIKQTLDVISQAADSIADGNLVEKTLRSGQNWSLLPLQGLFSTVLPSLYMSGYMGQRIEFPQWLGKNSSRNKHDRILQELKTHMTLSASTCMKTDINMDYVSFLRKKLTNPLLDTSLDPNVAAKEVIELLHSYNLTREDWESIIEVGTWGKDTDILGKIPSKVKSAFTRLFNKEVHKNPYALHQPAKKVKAVSSEDIDVDNPENAPQEESDEEEDPTKDAMIKIKKEAKKTTNKSKAKENNKRKATTSKVSSTSKKETKKKKPK